VGEVTLCCLSHNNDATNIALDNIIIIIIIIKLPI
jgi:hypothetical protein